MKTYKVDTKPSYSLHGSVDTRAQMFRERLLLTQQRLLRSGLFVMRGMGSTSNTAHSTKVDKGEVHELSTIESLLGSEGTKVLFGMLTQPEEGAWFLEDLESTIKLDLTRARSFSVLFTEGSQVIVQGHLVGSVFRVQVLGFPLAEERETTLSAMNLQDPFGYCERPQQHLQMKGMNSTEFLSLTLIKPCYFNHSSNSTSFVIPTPSPPPCKSS